MANDARRAAFLVHKINAWGKDIARCEVADTRYFGVADTLAPRFLPVFQLGWCRCTGNYKKTVPPTPPCSPCALIDMVSPSAAAEGTVQEPLFETEPDGSVDTIIFERSALMVAAPAATQVLTPAVSELHSAEPFRFQEASTENVITSPGVRTEKGSVQLCVVVNSVRAAKFTGRGGK